MDKTIEAATRAAAMCAKDARVHRLRTRVTASPEMPRVKGDRLSGVARRLTHRPRSRLSAA